MKISPQEARQQSWSEVLKQQCPYCNAPPGTQCARRFRYADGFDPDDYSQANSKNRPPWGQNMWTEYHKPRAEQVILGRMFIIPEAFDLADVY